MQTWATDYSFEDPDTYEDGYNWQLLLQFKNGSVKKHSGSGIDMNKVTSANFNGFIRELTRFVEDELQGVLDDDS